MLAVVSGMLLFGLLIRYWMIRNEIADSAFESASRQAIAAAEQLEQDFGGTMLLTEELAQDLSDGTLAYDDVESRLLQLLEQNPGLDGITVAFDHGAYSPEYDLYFIYVTRDPAGGLRSELNESLYDYTLQPSDDPDAPQTAWYYVPANSGPAWTEPFLATGAGRVLIEYGVPFQSPEPGGKSPPASLPWITRWMVCVRWWPI